MTRGAVGLSDIERRNRIGLRHRLAPAVKAESVVDAARSVVCLHGTDPSSVYLAAAARMRHPSIAAVDDALHAARTLVRLLAMRRTVFVVPVDDAPMLQAAAATGVARVERRRTESLVAQLEVGDVAGWLREAEAASIAELDRRGEATASELAAAIPMLSRRARLNPGQRIEGEVSMASRVLLTLGVEGVVVRGRPRGSWVSSQYRWSTMAGWLGSQLAVIPEPEAQALLVQRYLARFGPATESDIRWWTGWPARSVRPAMTAAGAVPVTTVSAGEAYVLADDLEPTPSPEPWVALLPPLDPTTMGWQERTWYLGEHRAALFDTAGNAGPTIWSDGRIVGGWAILRSGDVVTRLLDDIGREASLAVDAEAARLAEWLRSATDVIPRMATTPLAKQLVAEHDAA